MSSPNAPSDTPRESGPSVRLDHAAVTTTDIDRAIAFYGDVIGLEVADIAPDPLREGRTRAMLTDAEGREVLELLEMSELEHPAIPGRGGTHHLGFRFPEPEWHTLRARLDAADHPYRELEDRLFVRDADGLILEIEYGQPRSSPDSPPKRTESESSFSSPG